MAQDGWKPIDTAPADVELLVFTRQWGPIIARRDEQHGEWLSRMQVPVSLADPEDGPTHWHPLPDPPADAGGLDADETIGPPADDKGGPAPGEGGCRVS